MDVQPDQMRMHGFWTMTRTLLDEVLGFRPDFIQHQLAHVVRDPLGRAYNRTARLPQRREMMQEWADYLDFLKSDTRPNTRLLDHESLISRSEPKSKKSNCLTYRVHRCSRAGKRSRTQGQAKPSAASRFSIHDDKAVLPSTLICNLQIRCLNNQSHDFISTLAFNQNLDSSPAPSKSLGTGGRSAGESSNTARDPDQRGLRPRSH